MEKLFPNTIVSTMNSEIKQVEKYKQEFEDEIKAMETKTALKYIRDEIKSIRNVPLKDELYCNVFELYERKGTRD